MVKIIKKQLKMKKVIEFIKKNKLYILGVLAVFFFMRSCQKSVKVKSFEKQVIGSVETIDSLNNIISNQGLTINSFPEKLREVKLGIHLEYDGWISSKDRGPQLMELHPIVKNNIKESQKK